MNKKTDQSVDEQIAILPETLRVFAASQEWQKTLGDIALEYSLTEEQLDSVRLEVLFVLIGLVHPDEFRSTLEKEVGLQGSVLDAVADATEQRIFASVRPALVEFFEREPSAESEEGEVPAEPSGHLGGNDPMAPSLQAPTAPAPTPRIWEREPDIAPDNLPTDEGPESFLPPIPPKPPKADAGVPSWDITPTHPFEEKMKKVFTAGQQSMGELAIEPAVPHVAPPDTSRLAHDPYREPIE